MARLWLSTERRGGQLVDVAWRTSTRVNLKLLHWKFDQVVADKRSQMQRMRSSNDGRQFRQGGKRDLDSL